MQPSMVIPHVQQTAATATGIVTVLLSLSVFVFGLHKQPTRECQKMCKSSICGDQMVDPLVCTQVFAEVGKVL
jgi:hypothetical protein